MDITVKNHWNDELSAFDPGRRDIYYTEEYLRLGLPDNAEAQCIICKESENVTIMPFWRRSIGDFYDFETPYGYGGFISNTDNEKWISDSIIAINKYFTDNGYLCGFVRFHPLLHNAEASGQAISIIYDRDTVAMDCSKTEKEIWENQISSKNRNMIRKAEKNGLIYSTEYSAEAMRDFRKLYVATMERIHAEDFYLWNDSYFTDLLNMMPEHAFIGTIRLNGKMISAAIFMVYDQFGHYHLSGSDVNLRNNGAGNLLLWRASLELKNRGVGLFHLGGGNNSDDMNSLLKFKTSFSPFREKFYIAKLVFNPIEYDKTVRCWESKYPEKADLYKNRLLCYRF